MKRAIDIAKRKVFEYVFRNNMFLWGAIYRLIGSNCKHLKQMSFLLLIATFCSGCTSAYWENRGRDALDMVSFGYGSGWGVKVQALGVGKVGLLVDFPHTGLRGGEFVQSEIPYFDFLCRDLSKEDPTEIDVEGVFLIIGFAQFKSARTGRGKNYEYFHVWTKVEEGSLISASEYTNIEICLGLGPSLRFGINPGEILDFLLGWFGVDIYNDDVAVRDKGPGILRDNALGTRGRNVHHLD